MKKILITSLMTLGISISTAMANINSDNLKTNIQQSLNNYIKENQDDEHISALVVTISPSLGNIERFYAGTSEYPNKGTPVDTNNLFQIGSVTKSFTAVILLKLQEEGKLNLNDKIGKYLPQYSKWGNATIRSLLNMTSGIPSYSSSDEFTKVLGENIQESFSYKELANFAYQLKPVTGFSYSNTGYILAAMIAEKVTNKPFTELMDNLIKEVGLKNTYYVEAVYPDSIITRLVSGYYYNLVVPNLNRYVLSSSDPMCHQGDKSTDMKCSNMSWAGPAGGIVSNNADVTTWVRNLFTYRHKDENGKEIGILSKKSVDELTALMAVPSGKPLTQTDKLHPAGFGLGVGQNYSSQYGRYWHYQGTTLGYRMFYAYFPEKVGSHNAKGLIITIALNSQPVSCLNHINELLNEIYNGVNLK